MKKLKLKYNLIPINSNYQNLKIAHKVLKFLYPKIIILEEIPTAFINKENILSFEHLKTPK